MCIRRDIQSKARWFDISLKEYVSGISELERQVIGCAAKEE